MERLELLKRARAIVAERWSSQHGYGTPDGPVCAVGALVEPVREDSAAPYCSPGTVALNEGDAFDAAIRALYACLPDDYQVSGRTRGFGSAYSERNDIEDWNDDQGDVNDVLAVFDCAIAKAGTDA